LPWYACGSGAQTGVGQVVVEPDWRREQNVKKMLIVAGIVFLALSSVSICQELPGPAEGKARVYFFHFLAPMMGRHPVELFDGNSYLGHLDSSYCRGVDLDPGEHLLWARSANQNWFLRSELEAGRTYYVHMRMIPPKFVGPLRPSLVPGSSKDKKTKKTLKKIEDRLAKGAFAVHDPPTAANLEQRGDALKSVIEETMARWDSEWSKGGPWLSLGKGDYVR
jgi:hypothetical protein